MGIDHHHCSGVPCDICGPDPRDAEIARLKADGAMLADKAAAAIRERDQALAANAEMRAALEEVREWRRACVGLVPRPKTDAETLGARIDAALSRPDLGAGVVVPREVVERARDEALQSIATTMVFINDSPLIDRLRAIVADLDALLKKGGG